MLPTIIGAGLGMASGAFDMASKKKQAQAKLDSLKEQQRLKSGQEEQYETMVNPEAAYDRKQEQLQLTEANASQQILNSGAGTNTGNGEGFNPHMQNKLAGKMMQATAGNRMQVENEYSQDKQTDFANKDKILTDKINLEKEVGTAKADMPNGWDFAGEILLGGIKGAGMGIGAGKALEGVGDKVLSGQKISEIGDINAVEGGNEMTAGQPIPPDLELGITMPEGINNLNKTAIPGEDQMLGPLKKRPFNNKYSKFMSGDLMSMIGG